MNSVHISGHLGNDPQLKFSESGMAICNFSIAVSEGRDKPPSWVNITAFQKTAEIAGERLRKGSGVAIEGRLKEESWEDRETGKKRSKLYVIANRIEFLEKRDSTQSSRPSQPTAQPVADIDGIPF